MNVILENVIYERDPRERDLWTWTYERMMLVPESASRNILKSRNDALYDSMIFIDAPLNISARVETCGQYFFYCT